MTDMNELELENVTKESLEINQKCLFVLRLICLNVKG